MLRILWVLVVALGVSSPAPSWAEVDRSSPAKQEADVKSKESSKQVQKRRPVGIVPFAGYEERLKNSEKWKEMSPEEQEEALAKIQHYRERFRKNEVDRQKAYRAILQKKHRKRRSVPHDNEEQLPNKPLKGDR